MLQLVRGTQRKRDRTPELDDGGWPYFLRTVELIRLTLF